MKHKILMALTVLMLVFSRAPKGDAIYNMADIPSGSLIKITNNSAVYYFADNKRYVFPNESTYFSWYDGFADVLTIDAGVLAEIPIGGNVTYRPGKYLVKIVTSPKVYAVENGGVLRWVKTEDSARSMYGANWRYQVRDVPDAFFVNYQIDATRPINSGADYSPSAVMNGATNIQQDKNSVTNGNNSSSGSSAPTGSTNPPTEYCGDGSCNNGETCSSCAVDCGVCPAPAEPPPVDTASGLGGELIQPSDFVYQGAFRLPTHPEWMGWEWGGDALTYYPSGDPTGPADGYPGSLYGTGHAWNMNVSEISIPTPVISASKNPANLNRAGTLQPFTDVRNGLFNPLNEIIRVALAYLPAQGAQTTDKLYLAFGQHFQEAGSAELIPSHMWCELDLTDTQGAWWVDGENIYSVNDYMFDIPSDWADQYVGGNYLATGRYRDGGWSGQGPSLYAIAPWKNGNPPASGTHLTPVTLLQYETSYENDALFSATARTVQNYHHTDTWTGASWLTAGDKSAVAFIGTKGFGDYWYGDINGPCMDCASQRGWWSTDMGVQLMLYDPADLAQVANGTMEPWEPQPYRTIDLDGYMFRDANQVMFQVGAMAFDRARSLLYVFEPLVDEDRPIVHVWRIN